MAGDAIRRGLTMDVKEKYFGWGDGRKLKQVKAIVLHWDGSKGIVELDTLWKWMNRRGIAMQTDGAIAPYYHYLISRQNVWSTMSRDHRAIHCGHRTYRDKAKKFFGGNICSPDNSPNNYTIGICMLHDIPETGGYHSDTTTSAITLCARLCNEYGLDPMTDLLRHSDITNEKATPCPKAFFEDDERNPDDLWNDFKHWVNREMRELFGDPREKKSKEKYL